jgi:hypothetical protein
VRFEANIDFAQGTFKCNCSICTKVRNWLAAVPPADFRLLAGESELTEYQFHARRVHHLFCRHCGVRPFGWGDTPEGGRFYAVSVMCLDDVDVNELVNEPVQYVDGRNEKWDQVPAETRHL